MAHPQQLMCVKRIVDTLNLRNIDSAIEIGSWDINGSVREFFNTSNYLGLDVYEGKM